jgi:uncharacterized protein YodC (DUF2158 family)
MWEKIRAWIFGPKPNFKPGDSVELKDGGCLMVVIEVITNNHLKEPIINCKWYDHHTKENRTNLFGESKLKRFDWHKANLSDVGINKWGKVQGAINHNHTNSASEPNLQLKSHQLNEAK